MTTTQKKLKRFDEVYDSSARPYPLFEEIRDLIKYKGLIIQFVSRSIKTRYKRSVLGVVWTMLNPLLTMIVLILVFSYIFRFSIENYSIYVLSGLIMWSFFSSSTSASMGDMIWSGSLLGRIYMPKSVFAVSAVGTGLFNLIISLIPLLLIALVLEVDLSWSLLSMIPAIILLALFALGIGLMLSTAAVYFADMLPVYEVILTIWFYSTPIIYPLTIIPSTLWWIFRLNPLYYLLEAFRQPIYNGTVAGLDIWLPATGFAILALITGGVLFTTKSSEYAFRI